MRLLSVDWDYFFPTKEADPEQWQLYDWGHNENWGQGLQGAIWDIRAATFLRHGYQLPTTTGEESEFWDRFTFNEGTPLYLMESHSQAATESIMDGITCVVSYDAHHDCGYSGTLAKGVRAVVDAGQVTCQDWMVAYRLRFADLEVRYPQWRLEYPEVGDASLYEPVRMSIDDGALDPRPFDRIVVARSGSWVPPWLDQRFEGFVESCPVKDVHTVQPVPIRPFDLEHAVEASRVDLQLEGGSNE